MVEISGEEMNHFYKKLMNIDDVEIGETEGTIEIQYIELFQRGLAIASELNRLPMIRSIDDTFYWKNVFNELDTGNVAGIVLKIAVWNGYHPSVEFNETWLEHSDLLYYKTYNVATMATVLANMAAAISQESGGMVPKESSILGRNKITIAVQTECAAAVSGGKLEMDDVLINVEIDWKPISKKQLNEFIQEDYFREADDDS